MHHAHNGQAPPFHGAKGKNNHPVGEELREDILTWGLCRIFRKRDW